MSRIIVKNIPTKIDETKLRELFEQCGQVTDVKIQKCRSGRSRHFGFVGYHSELEAETAVKHFNKTFLNSVRIEVEIAKRYGDPSIPRPWSRYAKGSSAYAKLQMHQSQNGDHDDESSDSTRVGTNKSLKDQQLKYEAQKSKLTEMLGDYYDLEKDPTFKEFISLHSKKDKRKTWNNELAEQADEVKPKVTSHIESVEAKRPGGKGILLTRTHLKFEESESESEEPVNDQSVESRSKLSDVDYLRSKVVKRLDDDQTSSGEDQDDVSLTEDHVSFSESCDEEKEEDHQKLTLKMRGLPFSVTEKDIKNFFHPVNIKEIRLVQTAKGRPSGRAFVDFYNEGDLKQSLKHHKEYINNRYIELFIDEGPAAVREVGGANKEVGLKHQQPLKHYELGSKGKDESLLDSGRLFVRNLPYSVTEEEITVLFEKYGPLTEVTIPVDKEGTHAIGYAFVTFVFPEHAVKALEELDGSIFQGRLLHLMPSKDKDLGKIDETLVESSSYKKKKKAKQKAQASSSHNWNTLFLGQNAVVDAMASQFGTSKSAILDPESRHSSAVNVALGETHLIEETKEFLESNGVDLSCFGPGKKQSRSKTVILVKNLPYGTTADELAQLFSAYGGFDHVILPPAGVTAIVKFFEAQNAKSAFRALAYTKFKQLPLYLEWAPDGMIKLKPTTKDDTTKDDTVEDDDDITADSSTEGATVFVKNLNFKTDDEELKTFFSKCGSVFGATIAKKHNTKDPSTPLSMGFGFVEYKTYSDASKAIKQLQHKLLDGHQLELKLSHKRITKNPEQQQSESKDSHKLQETSKLLVRNVPFEATSKELKEVFGTFGELKTLRLPKKLGKKSGHRGFAFVEYVTKHDAKRAFDSLHYSTHLYGRRLVLEWAGLDDTVADIRRKTSQQLQLPGSTVKRRKLMEQLLSSTEVVDEE